jgi:hypothetical protein
VEGIKDIPCYDPIIARYPGIDAASKAIVKILCDDQVSMLDPGYVYYSDQGIEAIGDALQQNLNLRTLRILSPRCLEYDCEATFGRVLATALKVNHRLQNLHIELMQSSLATQFLLSSLNCFNLRSLAIYQGRMNQGISQAFASAIGQVFPLINFTLSSGQMDADSVGWISESIGKNRCLKVLDFFGFRQTLDDITAIFIGIGNSTIERFFLPAPTSSNFSFSTLQKQAILYAVESNPCFLGYNTLTPPFPSFPNDLAAAIRNRTAGRVSCPPDPQCNITPSCLGPSEPPSPPPVSSFNTIIGVVSAIAAVSFVVLGIFATIKCRAAHMGESEQLLSANRQVSKATRHAAT